MRFQDHLVSIPFGDAFVTKENVDVKRLMDPMRPLLRPQLGDVAKIAPTVIKQLPVRHESFYASARAKRALAKKCINLDHRSPTLA